MASKQSFWPVLYMRVSGASSSGGQWALLDSMEAGRWAKCRRPLWLLVNQVKDFSPLHSHGAKGRGVPDTPLLSKRRGCQAVPCSGLRRADCTPSKDRGADRLWPEEVKTQPARVPFLPSSRKTPFFGQSCAKAGTGWKRTSVLIECEVGT